MANDPRRKSPAPARRPDCVTKIRMGNTILTVSGYFKQDTTDTAVDKMAKALEAENLCRQHTDA